MSRIVRVFLRRTRATPTDGLAAVGRGPTLLDEADEVRVSTLFTWDRAEAERLARQWSAVAPASVGGPAFGSRGEEFVPGMYVKDGYVITSRGCPNRCWFCSVWRREGNEVRELPITPGHNVLDDNLLACSERHIRAVFDMLRAQESPVEFTGGWEAARIRPWHVDLLATVKLGQVWFAYDEDADLEPLAAAGKMLREAGFSTTGMGTVSHKLRCYCLIGWPGDTLDGADARLRVAYANGFLPMAMLYRGEDGKRLEPEYEWRRFQRWWARPASINRMCRDGVKASSLSRVCTKVRGVWEESPPALSTPLRKNPRRRAASPRPGRTPQTLAAGGLRKGEARW